MFYSPQRSTVRHCHSAVDPAPYVQMCTTKSRKPSVQEGCHAAAAYVEACAAAGVSVRIPPQCIRLYMIIKTTLHHC